jgi:hypothetical protein
VSHVTPERLYELLPAVYRRRDADLGYPLRDLVAALAEQAMVLEGDIARLYESWFIETCESWVVPYLGDLIGVRGALPAGLDQRAEVANTLGYRSAKGTLAILEQLARDVTGWPARAVEMFELLSATQHLNHLRPHSLRTPDLRRADLLEHLGGPFETAAHTVEVRRIAPRRGRYNIPNIALYLWRLAPYRLDAVQPTAATGTGATGRNFTFNTLELAEPLFTLPVTESAREHLAEEINLPAPIRRRALRAGLKLRKAALAEAEAVPPESYYGEGLSIEIFTIKYFVDPNTGEQKVVRTPVPGRIKACDLDGWLRDPPQGTIAIDPVLGRLAFGPDTKPAGDLRVTYHYGFSADLGGGPYERQASFTHVAGEETIEVGLAQGQKATLLEAVDEWKTKGTGIIEIRDSRTYEEALPPLAVPPDARLVVRAANGQRPTLLLREDLRVAGGPNSELELNGLLLAGRPVRLRGGLERAHIRHCTLVPARNLGEDGRHLPSLFVRGGLAEVIVERSILGTVRSDPDARVAFLDSILDATPPEEAEIAPRVAFGGVGGGAGGSLRLVRCTVIGSIHAGELPLAENSLLLDAVLVDRRQTGCVRFCWLPPDSLVPRRFHCLPDTPCGPAPRFTSLQYGRPGYCQLTPDTPEVIRRGADDESEIGVFSSLHAAQREDYLRLRLDESLRVGLQAGIFFVT